MHHFKRIKKKNFRTIKGWKKEVEEISIVFLLFILVIVGFSAGIARAQSGVSSPKGIPFMGIVIAVVPCPMPSPATPTPTPCTTLYSFPGAPAFAVTMAGFPFQMLDFTAANMKDGSVPRPGGFVGGSAIPGVNIATDFYSY